MAEKVWHYSVGDDRHGPVTAEELKRLASTGEIGPNDLVWKQGMANWVAADTVKGLIAKPTTKGPPPLPPKDMPAAPAAPPALGMLKQDDNPAKTQTPNFLQPIVAAWQKMPTAGKIGVAGGGVLFVLLVCGGGFAFIGSRFLGGASALDATRLARDYDADRKAADAKYKGKTLTVTGIIDIPYKGQGFATVHLEVPDGLKNFPMVTADFGAKHEAELQKLKRGDTIRFRGQCEGDTSKPEHSPSVHFLNCELLSPGGSGGGGGRMNAGSTRGGRMKANGRPRTGMTQAELNGLDFTGIMARLGRPSETYRARRRANMKLAVWPTGDDKYITVTYLEAIDGTSRTLIMTRNTDRPRYVVENLKKTLENQ